MLSTFSCCKIAKFSAVISMRVILFEGKLRNNACNLKNSYSNVHMMIGKKLSVFSQIMYDSLLKKVNTFVSAG